MYSDNEDNSTPPPPQPTETLNPQVEEIPSGQTHSKSTSHTTSTKSYRRDSSSSLIIRLLRAINYPSLVITLIIPIIAIYQSLSTHLNPHTLKFAIAYYVLTISSFHAGYHRLYAHRSFTATRVLEIAYLLLGASCGLGSVKTWVPCHRAHHRYVDTEKDPSYVRKGIVFSHLGNVVLKPRVKVRNSIKECLSDDLINDVNGLLQWQDSNYYEILILFGYALPTLICGLLYGDYYGGFIYAGVIRMFIIQQSIMSVNSVGHLLGTQPYDDRRSHRDNFILSLLTFGEGYNNFHHEFSADFRNGLHWYQFDPVKYQLIVLSKLGLVKGLNSTPLESITQVRLQQQQKLIDRRRAKLNWGVPIDQLPLITPAEFKELAAESYPERTLIAVAGIVHDVTPFVNDHPGGITLIKSSVGKDATSAFNGAVYDHSTAAHNLLATMRIAVLSGDGEVKVWRKQTEENVDVPLMRDSRGQRIVRSGGQATIVKGVGRTAGAA